MIKIKSNPWSLRGTTSHYISEECHGSERRTTLSNPRKAMSPGTPERNRENVGCYHEKRG
uniref:Uncharacterized protein n=1 Tax=Timema cristinae TaxID=61476 RepID=A0A7R9DR26_TIMCR|nr:unnamed protein product [Timema cristinae]